MKKENVLMNDFVKNADNADIEKIDNNLSKMKKGKIMEIWDNVEDLYKMIKDPNVAWGSKSVAIGALIYLISPIDAVPDIVPIAGLADDVGIITTAIALLANELKNYKIRCKLELAAIKQAEKELEDKRRLKFWIKIISLIGCFVILVTFIINYYQK